MRSVFRKLSVIALVAAAAGLSVVGCSSNTDKPTTASRAGDPNVGSVGMQLLVATNAPIDHVHYVVTQNGGPVVAEAGIIPVGDIPVPGNSARDFVFALTLPVGTGYHIKLTAEWDDPDDADSVADITCESTADPAFNIAAGTDIGVTVPMLCKNVGEGDVHFDVDVASTACPDLHMGYAVATPRATTIGTPVSVLSSAKHDIAGTTLAYAWSVSPASGGNFANAALANTTFNCTAASAAGTPHVLTVKVTAGTGLNACSDTLSVPVSCANLLCGNGAVDPGETCDDAGAPGGCPADCTQVCGDSNQEGTEACDFDSAANPTGTATCTATCQVRAPLCGDNFKTPPEACDDGNLTNGDGCESNCTLTPVAVCGDGVKQGSEACDPTAAPGSPWNCSDDCSIVSATACEAQETACKDPGAAASCNDTGLTTAQKHDCYNLLECMRTSNCAKVAPEPCFCGAVDVGSCSGLAPLAAAGPCARLMETAMGTTVPAQVLGNFANVAVGGAHAVQRVLCDEAFAPACFF